MCTQSLKRSEENISIRDFQTITHMLGMVKKLYLSGMQMLSELLNVTPYPCMWPKTVVDATVVLTPINSLICYRDTLHSPGVDSLSPAVP